MKWLMFFLSLSVSVWAMDESDVEREIATTRSVEALSQKMENAPKQYRHRYLEAIKALVVEENTAKREAMMQSLTGSGRGGGGNAGGGSGSGSGSGGGGKGGGNGGGRGGK
jgi:uncharacterized membrane protein YgcG